MPPFIVQLQLFLLVLGYSTSFFVKSNLKRSSSMYSSSKLGTLSEKPLDGKYQTNGNILVDCEIANIKDPFLEIDRLIYSLDDTKGTFSFSSYLQILVKTNLLNYYYVDRSLAYVVLRISWSVREMDSGIFISADSNRR